MPTDPPLSRLRARATLVWRTWGDEVVVYDPDSGDTHLLDTVGGAVLGCLQAEPLAIEACCAGLADRLGIDDDPALRRYVTDLVAQLERLGLIDLVPA